MTGSLAKELQRFEHLLGTRFPDALAAMNAGLDDTGVQRLRDLVSPYRIPADVETLYRWRDGGPEVFGGWRMRGLEDLAEWRTFGIELLQYPPAWLVLFDSHGPGFVELASHRDPSSTSVWWAYSHDVGVYRLFDSLAAFVATCSDLLEADRLVGGPAQRISLREEGLEGTEAEGFRLDRSPTAYRRTDPPEGTLIGSFADHTWPESWLDSVGLPASVRRLRGASHSIEQVISNCAERQVEATIVGWTAGPSISTAASSLFGFTDGTGELAVSTDPSTVGNPHASRRLEIDIVVEHGAQPVEGRWRMPRGLPAFAVAVREIED